MQSLICYFTELFNSVFVQATVVRIRVRESLCGGKHDHEYLISFFHLLFHYFVIKWIQVTYHGHSDIQKYDELLFCRIEPSFARVSALSEWVGPYLHTSCGNERNLPPSSGISGETESNSRGSYGRCNTKQRGKSSQRGFPANRSQSL